jgi:hypothetical protein
MLHTRKHTPTIPKKQKEAKIEDKDRSHKTHCKLQMGASARLQTKKKAPTAVAGQPAPTGARWMGEWMDRILSLPLCCGWTVMDEPSWMNFNLSSKGSRW